MVDLRNLLDDASLEDGPAADPLDIVSAGRRRVRRRGLVRGAALALVLVVSATALTLRPWESGETRGLEPVAPANPTPQPDETDSPLSPPGTQLELGETATVPVQHIRSGTAELTVTAIRRADRDDILSIPDLDPGLRTNAGRGEFWYVDVTITYLSGRIGGYYLDPDVEPVLRGGKLISAWILADSGFSPCPSEGLPLRPEVGKSVEDCVVFQTETGADVVGLQWGPFDTGYALAEGDPVTWRQ